MKKIKFKKMHGLSNDFIIIDKRAIDVDILPEQLAPFTHRKTGIGCDQIIPLEEPKDPKADIFMRILNAPDATQAQACGNATRCVASLLMHEKRTDHVVIQTVAGLLHCKALNKNKTIIEVDMGIPKTNWDDIPLSKQSDTLSLPLAKDDIRNPVGVNIGNPHAVFFVDDAHNFPVSEYGPIFENDPLFPEKANIEFATVLDRQTIRMRVWERDTGETDACGSAACATAVAGIKRGYTDRRCRVQLNGGNLDFHWRENDDHLLMTGPIAYVFDGEVVLD